MKKILLNVAMTFALSTAMLSAQAQTTIYGLTNANSIFTLSNPNSPGNMNGPFNITGVASGQTLVALDSRPSNGGLYALGYASANTQGQLYLINDNGNNNYSATSIGSAVTLNLGTNGNIGFDFISTADNQIRIAGTNGSNYVMNATNGSVTLTGNTMTYANGDLHAGATAAVGAMAYLNNYYGADNTLGLGYDLTTNSLVSFDQGNYGNGFNNSGNMTHSVGVASGILLSVGSNVGMDSWYDDVNHNNTVYLTVKTLLGTHLYNTQWNNNGQNLGILTDMGAVGNGNIDVNDIAFQNTPDTSNNISGNLMAALSLNLRNLVFFNSENGKIRNMRQINGMISGQTMVSIAFSSNLNLYGLGYNSNNQTYQLYIIDTLTGNVSAVNQNAGSLNLGTDNGSGNHINAAMSFMASLSNQMRVIGNNGNTNVVLDANTGLVIETDSAVQYVNGDSNFGTNVNLGSMAYAGDNNGGNNGTMWGVDFNTGAMIQFNSGNNNNGNGNGSNGYVSTQLVLSGILNLFGNNNNYYNGYMDILFDATANTNVAFMTNNYYGDSSNLGNYGQVYKMSQLGGTPAMMGVVGKGTPVKSMTARKSAGPESIHNIANTYSSSLLAYPNPVASTTTIVLSQASTQAVTVDIIDLNGRIARSYKYGTGVTNLGIDMSKMETGLYNARVMEGNVVLDNIKLVKE